MCKGVCIYGGQECVFEGFVGACSNVILNGVCKRCVCL